MSLTVSCPDCDKTLKVKDSAAGKKIRCPDCSTVFPVEAAADDSGDDFLSGLDQAVSLREKGAPVEDDEDFGFDRPPRAKSRTAKTSAKKKKPAKKRATASGKSLGARIWGGVVTTVVTLVIIGTTVSKFKQLMGSPAFQSSTWQTFVHPSGMAQIDMPGYPKPNLQQSVNGSHTFSLGLHNYQMSLTVAQSPQINADQGAATAETADRVFRQAEQLIPKQMPGGRLVSSQRLLAGTIQGIEMKIDTNGTIIVMRMYLFPSATVGAEFITRNESQYATERERFFKSLRGPDGNPVISVAAAN